MISPKVVKQTRKRFMLEIQEAADLIHASFEKWEGIEDGSSEISPAEWELFRIKLGLGFTPDHVPGEYSTEDYETPDGRVWAKMGKKPEWNEKGAQVKPDQYQEVSVRGGTNPARMYFYAKPPAMSRRRPRRSMPWRHMDAGDMAVFDCESRPAEVLIEVSLAQFMSSMDSEGMRFEHKNNSSARGGRLLCVTRKA